METEWILDVLADLRTFARQNGLPALAEQIDETCLLAAVEIASTAEGLPGDERGTAGKDGTAADLLGEGV
ncbi:MAG: hypothetical protein RIA08_02285 [Roseovarius sp.]|uniref:hypothetical protein n=1 Tax=Roseovarius sp. TaxID=1486281 RepID=UPI0032EC63B2